MFSCGNDGNAVKQNEDASEDNQFSAEETTNALGYVFPELDCGQDTFTIMNVENVWDMYTYIDFEQQTGEQLDDAVYNRNRKVEDIFNVKLDVIDVFIGELAEKVRNSVASNDGEYDAAYVAGEAITPLITKGMLTDLTTVPGLQLDKDWWNQSVLDSARVGDNGAVFFAVSDLSLTAFELTWCLMFNETIMEKMNIDKPYALVRDGKWTLDELKKYVSEGSNLNGNDSFKWQRDGNSVYGLTSYNNIAGEFVIGAGCRMTELKDGKPTFALDNERFYNFCETAADIFGAKGEFFEATKGDTGMQYEMIFNNSRVLFVGAELKFSSSLRDFNNTFGIVPAPKLDETQSEYYSWTNYLIPLLTIPKDCKNVERAGIILDALSYLSLIDVLPKYYDITVSQKGFRNDDSIEMLGIIRDGRVFDASLSYGWTTDFYGSLRNQLMSGKANAASLVAKNKEKVEAKIQATLDLVNGN